MKLQKILLLVTFIGIIVYFYISASKGVFPLDFDNLTESDIKIIKNYPTTPENVLGKYLEFDSKGAYLSKRGKKLLRSLNTANLFIQQELKTINIINNYKITKITTKDNIAKAVVTYELVGEVEDYLDFRKRIGKKNINVTLKKEAGNWKIKSTIFSHMKGETYVNFLNRNNRNEEAKQFINIIKK